MVISPNVMSAMSFVKSELKKHGIGYNTYIGNNFDEEKKDESIYRIISQIVDCVENGIVCILVNLNEIYQTFYDLLNQKYSDIRGKLFCRIAFGSDFKRVCVH